MKQDVVIACEKSAFFFVAKDVLHASNFNSENIIGWGTYFLGFSCKSVHKKPPLVRGKDAWT